MSKKFRMVTIGYLILLGMVLGAGLFAGVVVAPVTFHTEQWLGSEVLTQFQEGLIMTENFLRLSYAVTLLVVAVALYEGYKYKKFEREKVTLIATFFVVCTGLLFSYYYIPDILAMQGQGAQVTQSAAFVNTHKGSEINFKLFSLALLVLIVQNMRKACR